MDGNRRWASARGLPKAAGHTVGARKVRAIVQACAERGVRNLTLFAFSTENWRRPMEEVGTLMGLLKLYLQKFRNEGIFYENVTNRIFDDFLEVVKPRSATLESRWGARGGITSTITVSHTQSV
jgi:undecaprenyl diphosphate synthase